MHPAPAKYLAVELSAEGAAEWADRRRVVFVPRDQIVGIEVRRGIAGERPVLQVIVGVAAGGAPIALVGGWVLWTGVRPAYYLRVRTHDDARKLVLDRKVDLAQLSTMLEAARSRFGYAVDWAIDEPRPPAG